MFPKRKCIGVVQVASGRRSDALDSRPLAYLLGWLSNHGIITEPSQVRVSTENPRLAHAPCYLRLRLSL